MRQLIAVLGIIAIVLIIAAAPLSIAIVGPGEAGIKTTFGQVEDITYGEGLQLRIPIIQGFHITDVKTQLEEASASAASKDLQVVSTTVAVNYNVQEDAAHKLYQEVGTDYVSRIIKPAIQESIKSTTARFTAEELITQRPLVKTQLEETLREKLKVNYIDITAVNIINFDFSPQFNASIEAKVTEEQNVFKAENTKRKKEIEAEILVIEARAQSDARKLQADAAAYEIMESGKAQAEALKLQREQISEELNDFKAIEAWNGELPYYMGGGIVPFININEMS